MKSVISKPFLGDDDSFAVDCNWKPIDWMTDGVLFNALKGWTGKASATIIYDSSVDEFTDRSLFDRVKGKQNIALVGFTADGDVFGGFYNVVVTELGKQFEDPDIFVFSFESHGRCETPQRFSVKEEMKTWKSMHFIKNFSGGRFVDVGGSFGHFYLGNERSDTFCHNLSSEFEGIADTTLTGNTFPGRFTCTRVVAVHLN